MEPQPSPCRECGKAPATICFFLDPDTFVGMFCYDCFEAWLSEALRTGRITKEQLVSIAMSAADNLSEEKHLLLIKAMEELKKGDSN
jgi:hypothetical protein